MERARQAQTKRVVSPTDETRKTDNRRDTMTRPNKKVHNALGSNLTFA